VIEARAFQPFDPVATLKTKLLSHSGRTIAHHLPASRPGLFVEFVRRICYRAGEPGKLPKAEATLLALRLVQTIEAHAEEITRGVLEDLAKNPRTPSYHLLPRPELHRRAYEVYRNLGRWLSEKTDSMVEAWYTDLGQERCGEGIPLSEVVYALILTKYHLRDYIRECGLVESAVELYQEQELHRLVGHFFDKAMYYTVRGYEREVARRMRPAAAPAA
jgi:hypothetical protein